MTGTQRTKVGPFGRLKGALARGAVGTAGRLSTGIRLGQRHGFDSGLLLDYVYANRPHGYTTVGRLIDGVFLGALGCRAVRARKELLRATLTRLVREDRQARVLDVASGPGRYLLDMLRGPGTEHARVLCRDVAESGLRLGARRAAALDLGNVFYERGDAFESAPTTRHLGGRPTVVVVSGLYELLLDDALIRKSMEQLHQLLEPGGTLVFTTQTHRPQPDLIAGVLRCRSAAKVEEMARQAGFIEVGSVLEPVGVFAVTTCRKPVVEAEAA